MAGKRSRDKGNRGELEVRRLLQPIVDRVCEDCGHPTFILRKNQDQRFAAKQYDVIGVPWIALEVKRQEILSVNRWWRQTLAATRDRQTPVLFYRQNRKPWRIRMRVPIEVSESLRLKATVTVDLPTFKVWFEHKLRSQLER